MRIRILPYSPGSRSAFALREGLNALVLRLQGGNYTYHRGDMIINWGNNKRPDNLKGAPILNEPEQLSIATNKLKFFELMREAESQLIPDFWTSPNDIPDDAYPIVCRQTLTGHSGEGIVIADNPDQLVTAPLYVRYIKKKQEYRVHVGNGQIIALQRKARKLDVPDEEVNWKVRNLQNGFIYMRQEVSPPPVVAGAAVKALIISGLDFGAVDVVYHEGTNGGQAKVLEINTAPGITGATVTDYVNYFTTRGGMQ